jgi:hypothetical protein
MRLGPFIITLLCAYGGAAQGLASSCPQPTPAATQIVARLQQLGYNVQCGALQFQISTQGQCGTVNGAVNPSTCYGEYNLPARTGGSLKGIFDLDDDEAVITIGTLPPPVFYYGYYTYMEARSNPTVSPPAYVPLLNPFGPVINQRNVDTALHGQVGGPAAQLFATATAFVTTANAITQGDIASALASAFGAIQAQNMITIEKLPVDLLQLGSTAPADQLKTAFRLTPFNTPSGQFDPAAVQYMLNPPLEIFRVSPVTPRTGVAAATYHLANDPMPQTKIVAGEVWEQTLLGAVGVADATAALQTIINNVISNRAALGETLQQTLLPATGANLQGRRCIAAFQAGVAKAEQLGKHLLVTSSMSCADASPDAAYYGPPFGGSFAYPSGGEVVWIGVNHGTLGSATYSNLAVQSPSQYVAALTNVDLNGSAAPFIGTLPAASADDFYVASVSASCQAGSTKCLYAPGDTQLILDERAYLAPSTATMPDYTDIVPSVWLIFGPS